MNYNILNYQIEKVLGEGGMSRVYLGVDPITYQKVAIKELFSHLTQNQEIRDRFRREAQVLASLNHSNIVRLIRYEETDKHLYLVQEYIDGNDLYEYIKNYKGAIDEIEAIKLFCEILDAFIYAHSKGVIHRDIKPSNIILDHDNHIKILDFGIAKILTDELSDIHTKTGVKIGTLLYMSPEQVLGENISYATDIYSLGVLLFQMLTGKPPYDYSIASEYQILKKIVAEPLLKMSIIYPYISDELQEIVDKATSKQISDRYVDCASFKKAIISIENNKYLYGEKTVFSSNTVLSSKTLLDERRVPNDITTYKKNTVFGKIRALGVNTILQKSEVLDESIDLMRMIGKQKDNIFRFIYQNNKYFIGLAVFLMIISTIVYINQNKANNQNNGFDKIKNNVFVYNAMNNLDTKNFIDSQVDHNIALSDYNMGDMYEKGKGVSINKSEAFNLYKKAALQGNVNAENKIGYMYENGIGVIKNIGEAVKWYKKAAEQGNASAQNNLGYMYDIGRGVEKNVDKALKLYKKAAEQGNEIAQNNLGYMYDTGRGVEKDNKKAVRWYHLAALQGNLNAQYNLGLKYLYGEGVIRDNSKAIYWFEKARSQGHKKAGSKIAEIIRR